MQIIPRSLDLDAIYEQGFDAVALPRENLTILMDLISQTCWREDSEGVFNSVPSWRSGQAEDFAQKSDQEMAANEKSLSLCPPPLKNACTTLLRSKSLMGAWLLGYEFEIKFLSLWDGAEPLDWHWDGPANADFFFLVYLNDQAGWQPENGGQLQTGVRSLKGNYLRTCDTPVTLIETIAPAQRTLVCCNNQNPRFVHKVIGMNGAFQRRVLMIGFDAIPTLRGEAP